MSFSLVLAAVPLALVVATALCFALSGNGLTKWLRSFSRTMAAFCLLSLAVTACHLFQIDSASTVIPADSWATGWILTDGFACLLVSLISFLGWVVSSYCDRHLAGDPRRDRSLRSLSIMLLGCVISALAGRMELFVAGSLVASWGLHRVMTDWADTSAGRKAASLRMALSGVGDALLLVATLLAFRSFGTTDIGALSQLAGEQASTAAVPWLLVLAACLKSAALPFHGWLTDSLDMPTPLSALMHAGLVNAGGVLLIRFHFLVNDQFAAMSFLSAIGAVTAIAAGLTMMTQPAVKRTLIWSTVSQMGFMLLQCGLGAWSAATLHLLAHSIYKVRAFLSAGSALQPPARTAEADAPRPLIADLAAVGTAAGVYLGVTVLSGISPLEKPGSLVLGTAFVLGAAHFLTRRSFRSALLFGVPYTTIFTALFAAFYLSVDAVTSFPAASGPHFAVSCGVSLLLTATWLAERQFLRSASGNQLSAWRIHASHGFYLHKLIPQS